MKAIGTRSVFLGGKMPSAALLPDSTLKLDVLMHVIIRRRQMPVDIRYVQRKIKLFPEQR